VDVRSKWPFRRALLPTSLIMPSLRDHGMHTPSFRLTHCTARPTILCTRNR
jgi:hypothetical protein